MVKAGSAKVTFALQAKHSRGVRLTLIARGSGLRRRTCLVVLLEESRESGVCGKRRVSFFARPHSTGLLADHTLHGAGAGVGELTHTRHAKRVTALQKQRPCVADNRELLRAHHTLHATMCASGMCCAMCEFA